MVVDKKELKRLFPHLIQEIESEDSRVPIDKIQIDSECKPQNVSGCENDAADDLRNFNPTAIDFLRRCETAKQGDEIINYLHKVGEISDKKASELKKQLKQSGIRSFGPKKEDYYYFRQGGVF